MVKNKKQKSGAQPKNKKKSSNGAKVAAGVAVGTAAGAVLGYEAAKLIGDAGPKVTGRMLGAGLKAELTLASKIAAAGEKVVAKVGGLKAKIAARAAAKKTAAIIAKEGSKELVAKVGTKEAAKIAAKEAEKLSPKLVDKVGEETAAKTGSKLMSKEIAKAIPFVSLGIGGIFAFTRFKKGDVLGGFLELGSGALACVPLYGTAASLALDGGIIARDFARR